MTKTVCGNYPHNPLISLCGNFAATVCGNCGNHVYNILILFAAALRQVCGNYVPPYPPSAPMRDAL